MRLLLTPALATFLVVLALGIVAPQIARGAEFQPDFEIQLSYLQDNDPVSVILILSEQAPTAQLNAELKQRRAPLPERHVTVVSALRDASQSQADLLATLSAGQSRGDVEGFTSYWIANLVVARVTKAYLFELAARSDIAYIEPNFTVSLIEPVGDYATYAEPGAQGRGIGVTPGLRAINADRVWYELGINGTGVLVANCDTGVDGTHPALASRWRGALGHPASECWLNLIGGHPSFPYDGYGHGTHVMGTITGLGATTQDTIGVAWGALWIATDPINQGVGSEFDNDIITAYQWLADPDGNPNTMDDVPDVVQNSWRINEGFGSGYTDCDSRWWAVIDNCEAAGVVTTWSAGNEGPGSTTIGSPADRATTLTNTFSVGAIDATHYSYPYPIASFSSRGPTGCNVPADRKIKPEVCAPGVDVYSSVPGGGYEQDGWQGTSMAGPHVAGVVALMRQANPDLDVDTIKEIIMQTAMDHGTTGEDNTYGWGVVDAYEAVLAVMQGYGTLAGAITNASNGGTPVPGASIQVVEIDRTATSGADGSYAISVPAGIYTVTSTHPSFAPQTVNNVEVQEDLTTTVNFALVDIAAPVIANTTQLRSTEDTVGPYDVSATVTDYSALTAIALYYRVNGGQMHSLVMAPQGNDVYHAGIPGQPQTSHVEYYVAAADVAGNAATDPAGAPGVLYDFWVAPIVDLFSDTIEGGAGDWTHGAVTGGFTDQWHISTERNHTPGGTSSWKCGDTGTGTYANLLDAGLVTPVVELTEDSFLDYWQWIDAEVSGAHPGYAYDGGLLEISLDGGPWTQIFPEGGYTYRVRTGGTPGPFPAETQIFSGTVDWHEVQFDLSAYSGPARLRFRFGSDGADGREGWHIDDVVIDGFEISLSAVAAPDAGARLLLHSSAGNPFAGATTLAYELPVSAPVLLQVFDLSGRLVRTLVRAEQQAGLHQTVWDGRDGADRPAPAGVYMSRLQAGPGEVTTKLVLTR
jgi:subtilisin family serine protease